MRLTIFNIAFDTLFSFVSAFFALFIVLNYFTDKTPAVILSVTLALIFSVFAFKIIKTKRTEKWRKNALSFKAKEYIHQFTFFSETETFTFFKKVYTSLKKEAHKRKNSLVIPEENTAIFFRFGFEEPSKTDVIKAYNQISDNETAEIFCENYSPELKKFVDRFEGRVILKNQTEVYELLKSADIFPEIRFPLKEKSGIKKMFSFLFNKSRTKTFFVFGAAFAFMSFFVKFKAYYVFFSGAFLILAILCKLFGKKSEK